MQSRTRILAWGLYN